MIKKIKNEKPKILCLANPNSPTGTIIEKKNILKLIKTCKKNNCYILIDEAYYGFSKETSKNFVKRFENIFIVRSLSKAWGLAGLRLGYIISNKKILKFSTQGDQCMKLILLGLNF